MSDLGPDHDRRKRHTNRPRLADDPNPSLRRAGWRDLPGAVATSWAAEKRQREHGRTGQVPGRAAWRALILAGLVGHTFARWLCVPDDHRAVIAVVPAEPPPAWRHLTAPANIALVAALVVAVAAPPALIASIRRSPEAPQLALAAAVSLVALAVAWAVLINRFGAATHRRHAAARADIERRAPGPVALVANAASRGGGRGQVLWDPLFAEQVDRGVTLILQTYGDGLSRYWANLGFTVTHRVPCPHGDRVLMVRWPPRPAEDSPRR